MAAALAAALASCQQGGPYPGPGAYSPYSPYPGYGGAPPSSACGALGTCPPSNYPRLGPHDGAMGNGG
jgi:hypothetical protein